MFHDPYLDHAFTLNGKNISVIEDFKGSTSLDDTKLHGYIVELDLVTTWIYS
jgi:hypothetical protein